MIEKYSFKAKFIFEPNAASIGISSDDWYCHRPGMTRDEVRTTMKENKYDIVPIVNTQGAVTSYFTLNGNNTNEIYSSKITQGDTIYYLTHIKDVIWLMTLNKRSHYFLSNYQNEEIIGLISLSNLNCREFNLYLFSMLAFIEKELSNLISTNEGDALEFLKFKFNDENGTNQLKSIQVRISEDRDRNIDNDFKEYLYIHHLVQLVVKENQFERIGYSTAQDFVANTKPLKEIRNTVAHPVKSLVRNFEDLAILQKGLSKLYELKFNLEKYQSPKD